MCVTNQLFSGVTATGVSFTDSHWTVSAPEMMRSEIVHRTVDLNLETPSDAGAVISDSS